MKKFRALDAIARAQWACTPEYLETVLSVASRSMENPEAVLKARGEDIPGASWRVEVRNGVAVIPVYGGIFRHANLITEYCGATSIERLATDFNTALESPDVSAIILDIDSPGGEISGIHEFAEIVRAAGKPVVSYVGSLGASAAYWIASAANEVVADKTALLGSIGVLAAWEDHTEAKKAKGVKEYTIVSSQSPKKRLDIDSKEGRAEFQATLDGLADIFIADVAAYRGTTPDAVIDTFGRGGMLLAEDAVVVGMADRIGSLENLIAEFAASQNPGGPHMEFAMEGNTFTVDQIDRGWLAQNKPDLLASLVDEGKAEAASQAVTQERARVAAIDDLGIVGHDELVKKAKADGSSPEALAMAAVKAEGAMRKVAGENYAADAAEAHVTPAAVGTGTEAEDDIIKSIAAAANSRRK